MKKEKWILTNHLSKYYGKLPSSIADLNTDDLFDEEKKFLYYLEAYWGGKIREIQWVTVLTHEIDEIIEKDDSELVPESIKKSVERLRQQAPNEEARKAIDATIVNTSAKSKALAIQNIFDELKELLESEELARLKLNTQKKINDKNLKGVKVA